MAKFEDALTVTLREEGGLSDNPKDPGGRTMKGVTQKTYDAYRSNHGLVSRDVVLISDAELADVYRNDYWNKVAGDKLPVGLGLAVFDFAVNSGPGRAVEELQALLSITADGILGNQTLNAVLKTESAEALIEDYSTARLKFLRSLKNWKTFGAGWEARVSRVETDAVHLLLAATEPETHPAADLGTLTPPAGIQDYVANKQAKAYPEGVALHKTHNGLITILGSLAGAAPIASGAADQIKPYVGHDLVGQIATVAVILLTVVGSAFAIYNLAKPYIKLA